MPEQTGLSFSRKPKYVVRHSQKYDSKFPKTQKTGKKTDAQKPVSKGTNNRL